MSHRNKSHGWSVFKRKKEEKALGALRREGFFLALAKMIKGICLCCVRNSAFSTQLISSSLASHIEACDPGQTVTAKTTARVSAKECANAVRMVTDRIEFARAKMSARKRKKKCNCRSKG